MHLKERRKKTLNFKCQFCLGFGFVFSFLTTLVASRFTPGLTTEPVDPPGLGAEQPRVSPARRGHPTAGRQAPSAPGAQRWFQR